LPPDLGSFASIVRSGCKPRLRPLRRDSYVRSVKFRLTLALIGSLFLAGALRAQLTPEDIRQLQSRLQQYDEDIEALRARVQKMEAALADARQQVVEAKAAASAAGKDLVTQDQLKKVVDQLRDLDKRRQDDNEKIIQQLKQLGQTIASTPPPTGGETPSNGRRRPVTPDPGPEASAPEKASLPADFEFYPHVVGPNDKTLSHIISAYNKQYGLKVRVKHVLEANPKLKPERLIAGSTIKIPVVK
jgi:uncharacterized protein YhaN